MKGRRKVRGTRSKQVSKGEEKELRMKKRDKMKNKGDEKEEEE